MEFKLPYGRGHEILTIADDKPVQCLVGVVYDAIPKKAAELLVEEAMKKPYGGVSLQEMAQSAKSAVIICSDHTRPVPSKAIIPPMLKELRKGNPNIEITLLIATGFHRLTTKDELIAKFGSDIVECENIVVHDSSDDKALVNLGELPSGAQLWINKLAVECDLLLAEGFIEPHFFAGFSGGRKSVLPGIAGRQTVLGNHCGAFIGHPCARTGILENNPLHVDMCAATHMAGLKYIVNVVINGKKEILRAFAGNPEEAHKAGCDYLRDLACVKPEKKADIIITSNGGYPLDQNIYQAVKCMTAAESAAAENAVIIAAAFCEDGTGSEDFYRDLADCSGPDELYKRLAETPMDKTRPDQWESQVLARVMIKHKIIFVCNEKMRPYAEKMKFLTACNLNEAYNMAIGLKGENAALTIIPDGISVIVEQ